MLHSLENETITFGAFVRVFTKKTYKYFEFMVIIKYVSH